MALDSLHLAQELMDWRSMLGFFTKRISDFPVMATSEDDLKRISATVRMLCIDLPDEMFPNDDGMPAPFAPANGRLALVLTDQDEIYQKDWVSEFRLEIAGVSECSVKFEDAICGEDCVKSLDFRSRHNSVRINCVGCTLYCRVDGLMVTLEKVA